MKKFWIIIAIFMMGCESEFIYRSNLTSFGIPLTGYNFGITEFTLYGEGYVDIGELPDGVNIDEIDFYGDIENPTGIPMDLDVRVSPVGTATSDSSCVWFEYTIHTIFGDIDSTNKPAYVDSATSILSTTISAHSQIALNITSYEYPILKELVNRTYFWIIVKNTGKFGLLSGNDSLIVRNLTVRVKGSVDMAPFSKAVRLMY